MDGQWRKNNTLGNMEIVEEDDRLGWMVNGERTTRWAG
jgi:hypothetical protein